MNQYSLSRLTAHTILYAFIVIILTGSMVLISSRIASGADGDLDLSFGTGGWMTVDFGSDDFAYGVALQNDGKIIISGGTVSGDFAAARITSEGILDTSFGTDGWVVTDFGGNDFGYSVATQLDGKIVLAGQSNNNFAVVRYNEDGTLDSTFDGDGMVTTDLGFRDVGLHLAIQPDGKLVVVGFSANGPDMDWAIVRYNSDGTLDTSFATSGMLIDDFGLESIANSVAIQSDGKIVVVGSGGAYPWHDIIVARYNNNGSRDTAFGGSGWVTTDFGGEDNVSDVFIQADDKILIAGNSDFGGTTDFAIVRYNSDGSLDTTFDNDGWVSTDFGGNEVGRGLIIQSDGKIVVVGDGNGDFNVARYNLNGNLDTTFGTDGKVRTHFGGDDRGLNVAIQTDGKIVVVGGSDAKSTGDFDFIAARYFAYEVPDEVSIDSILSFFDSAIEAETIQGRGKRQRLSLIRLSVMSMLLETARDFIDAGYTDWACFYLYRAYLRSDGTTGPPDFVVGESVPHLNEMIEDLMEIQCE